MKSSLSLLLSAVVLPSLLAIGCGDDSTNNGDMAMTTGDLSGAKDMTAKACTMVATWPSSDIVNVYGAETASDPFDFVTSGAALKTTGSQTDALTAEIWHQASTPANPRTVSIPSNTTWTDCETCLYLDENYDVDQQVGDVGYLGRGGMVTITKADTNPGMGQLDVSGTNIQFVEWDFQNDKPVANGKCFEVGSFAIAGSYSNPDGGTDM